MYGIELKESEEIIDVIYRSVLVCIRSLLAAGTVLTATSYALFWLLEQGTWGQAVVITGYTLGVLLVSRVLRYWRGSKLVITTERVFAITQTSFFQKDMIQIRMRDIDDVIGNIRGFWGTIARLGEVQIRSKRNDIVIGITGVRRPVYIQDIILDQVESIELGNTIKSIGDAEVLAYMATQSVPELDALLRKAMAILRKKKET